MEDFSGSKQNNPQSSLLLQISSGLQPGLWERKKIQVDDRLFVYYKPYQRKEF